MNEQLNFTESFVDEDGNIYNPDNAAYSPGRFSVNELVIKGISRQIVRGDFKDF